MPYIKQKDRIPEIFNRPRDRGELNWSITTRCLNVFSNNRQGYADHCEMKAMLNEILSAIVLERNLARIEFDEFRPEVRDLMEDIDELVWDYMDRTSDIAGCKQVLRDVIHEWNRRLTDQYEDLKIKENGEVFKI